MLATFPHMIKYLDEVEQTVAHQRKTIAKIAHRNLLTRSLIPI